MCGIFILDSLNSEHGPTSDSENDDPEDNKNCTLQFGDSLSFKADAEVSDLYNIYFIFFIKSNFFNFRRSFSLLDCLF